MRILELHIDSFGKLNNTHINFSDRFNLIYGYNEAGKSTLHNFIKAMFFGMKPARGRAGKDDAWSRYLPWNSELDYSGSMILSHKNNIYRIERNFGRKSKNPLILIDTSTGKEIDSPQKFINTNFLNNMSSIAYDNTVSIGQLKSSTEHDMTVELKNYIANMNNSSNPVINTDKALELLKKEKRSYEIKIVPEASKSYAANLSAIKTIESKLNLPQNNVKTESLNSDKQKLDMHINELTTAKEGLISKISAGKQRLNDNLVSSASDIENRKKEAWNLFETYRNFTLNNRINMYKFAYIVSWALSAIFAIFIAYTYLFNKAANLSSTMSSSRNITMIFLIIALIIALLSALVCMFAYFKDRKTLSKYLGDLYELLNIHNRAAIEPGLSEFSKKMDKLLTVLEEVNSGQEKLENLNKELIESENQKQAIIDSIDSSKYYILEREKELERIADLSDENEALKSAIDENERLQFEITAIDLAIETIDSLSSTIKDSFGIYLNKKASELISGITGGIYKSMSIDENLDIYLNTKSKLIPLNQMSSATIDQVYLALRLAAAKLMSNEMFPLFLDDSFVNYDNQRLKVVLDYLYQNYKSQIIIFTCHTREEEMLRLSGAEFDFIKM